jgi:hypothetical protein
VITNRTGLVRALVAFIAAASTLIVIVVATPGEPAGAITASHSVAPLTLVNTHNVARAAETSTTTTQEFDSVTVQSDTSPEHIDLEWGTSPNLGHLQISSATAIVAGTTYTVYEDYSDGAGGQCGADYPGSSSVAVDQVSFAPGGALLTFSARVTCSWAEDSVGGTVATTVAYNITPTTPGQGYYLYQGTGQLTGFGNDHYLNYLGDLSATALNKPVVGMAMSADGGGYWMVASDGGVFNYGTSTFYGSMGGQHLNQPIVGMAADPVTGGYWLVASDGGIFSFNAPFYGSMGGRHLNQPIVGMAATPSGRGYWLVASDGGIFTFGDALFQGSTGSLRLNKPIVGMVTTTDGGGYWLVASDGGIFNFGDAVFQGSTGNITLNRPMVGMAVDASTGGYWLTASDGGVFTFNAPYEGGLGGQNDTGIAGITS